MLGAEEANENQQFLCPQRAFHLSPSRELSTSADQIQQILAKGINDCEHCAKVGRDVIGN